MNNSHTSDALWYSLEEQAVMKQTAAALALKQEMAKQQMAAVQCLTAAQTQICNGSALPGQIYSGSTPYITSTAFLDLDPNEEPAYQMDLTALKDLFRAMYGAKWVKRPDYTDDAFWFYGFRRLDDADLMERVDYSWFRLREGL